MNCMTLDKFLSLFWRWLLQLSTVKGVKTDLVNRINKSKGPEVTGFGDVFDGGGEGEEVKK